ncbi:MAG: universal stress protein [Caulobacterales bacterium]
MTTLSILAAVNGAPDDEAAVAIAADLAKRHASSVVVVNTFTPMPIAAASPILAGGVMSPMVWKALEEHQHDVRLKIHALVQHQAQRFGLKSCAEEGAAIVIAPTQDTGWATLMCELPLVDLAVVAQSSVSGEGPWTGPLGQALMDARAPVFVARDGVSAAGRSAAVAWDGSLEAGRAVRAAIPLLKDASEVAILQDPDGLDTTPGAAADPQRLMDYLRGHGVATETVIKVRGRKIGPTVLHAAKTFGAALLVAGAYRHSRLEEAILGGATRAFLAETDGPHLLISH